MGDLNLISFWTGVMSLCLGFVSFVASLFFYDRAKQTENENNKILFEIKETTRTLHTINNAMLERAIGHIASANEQLINRMPLQSAAIDNNNPGDPNRYLLMVYSYIVRTHFLAKVVLLKSSCEVTKSSLQKLINASIQDHKFISSEIDKVPSEVLAKSPSYDLYKSDKEFYGEIIKDHK